MCGIAGIYRAAAESAVDASLVEAMGNALAHRGPDDSGLFLDAGVGLAHRRLSIIDTAGSRQPMHSADGSLVIVFNGEIYNFKSLREELRGHGRRFSTQGDTEVILQAYEHYGPDCVQRLRGMFAFAIWDVRKRQLFLARDRVGIKPLYYSWDGRTLRFGSEIKALLQDRSLDTTIDPLGLDDYLTYLYIPAPKTIFKQIRKLPPGHTLIVSEQGVREQQYWDLSFEPRLQDSEAAYAAGLLDQLRESVKLHLVSDVPIGAFLSGGLDSSAVVGLMAAQLDRPVSTASIGFRESGFDELPYARQVARHFKTRAHEKTVAADAAKILDALVWFYDEPFADSSMVPTYYVSQVARECVTVCLSGDGGDENFAGYRRYRFDLLENRIRRLLPARAARAVFGTLARCYPKADWLPQIFRAKTLLTNLSLSPERAYFHTMSWFTPGMKRQLYNDAFKSAVGDYDAFSVMETHFNRTRGWDSLARIQYVDIKTYLPDDILTKVDRASMAHSLEVRVPLLDHRVMEYAAAIPSAYKLRGGEGKYIFKQSLKHLLPSDILTRRKMGFSVPLAAWMRQELRGVFEERVLAPRAFVNQFFNPEPIRQWWAQHQRGTRDLSSHLWALLVLECWGQRIIGSSKHP